MFEVHYFSPAGKRSKRGSGHHPLRTFYSYNCRLTEVLIDHLKYLCYACELVMQIERNRERRGSMETHLDYLMENDDEIIRLEIKTDIKDVHQARRTC